MPQVNHEILKWARETSGLEVAEAARRLGLRPTQKQSADARVAAFERGDAPPSMALLTKMADVYRRPLLTFFMTAPPRKAARGEDYRTHRANREPREEALLDSLLRDLHARQSLLRALLEHEEEATPVPFVASERPCENTPDAVARLADKIKRITRFSLRDFRSRPTPEAAFHYLRARVEAAGVFVLLVGDLGSHHSTLDASIFRGITLSDPYAPMIIINNHDAKTSLAFSLLHEMTHLCFGHTGISQSWESSEIERLCDGVASAVLLPARELGEHPFPNQQNLAALQAEISSFAGRRRISSTMVAYRLFQSRRVDAANWQQLRDAYQQLWREQQRARHANQTVAEGGPDYYVVQRNKIGTPLIKLVARMLREEALSTNKAGMLLNVKPSNVHSLIETVL